jgi:hypothetical protein
MCKFALPGVAIALLAGMSIASAASAADVIKSMDAATDMITLDNGSTYSSPRA